MITLAVCNHKGGTGKTTSSMNLAAAFGLSGRKVLVVDLDPQGFLTRMMGTPEPSPAESSLVLFNAETNYSALPIVKRAAFDLLPASSALSGAIRKLNRPLDVLWIKEFVRRIDTSYDLLILDTAAAVTVFTLNALVASDHVIIPVLPEYQPVLGGEQTFQTARVVRKKLNPSLKEPMFLLTMVDGRKRNHLLYRKYLRERYAESVMNSMIRTSTALSVTRQDGKTVFESDPRARGSIDYANAADELASVLFLSSTQDSGNMDPKTPPHTDGADSITSSGLSSQSQPMSL